MSRICSDTYRKFFDRIKKLTFDMDEFIEAVRDAISESAEELHIGYCAETFTAPKTSFYIDGIDNRTVLYTDENGYDEYVKEFEFRTGENGCFKTAFSPVKGYKWTEEELEDLEFVASQLFILGGRVQMLGAMKKSCITDPATGAANINGFAMHCEQLAARKMFAGHTVFFINIKNFKFINTLAGERQGDIILKHYAYNIMRYLEDTEMLARPGGDNFIVLIKNERAEKFQQFISNTSFTINVAGEQNVVNVNSRMGVYQVEESDTFNRAISAASTALKASKQSGRLDVIRFSPEMLDRTLKANEISNLFTEAIKNEEFCVYYQPKVSLADNKLCGCEALTRWIRNGVIVPPGDFIPVLEHEGTVCRLDFYVLERVCRDIRRWLDSGIKPVRVSTNFSKLHLYNADFAENIVRTIRKYDIDPHYIEVELTESTGYEDYEALAEFVKRMKSFGISTSIDDFGTGYSSLNLLKDLEVDIIKLDKSFLDNLGDTKKTDKVVIKNIVSMVNELDMKVVAEGVETNQQAALLEGFECSMAQGYLFDKPLPCDEFEKRLRDVSGYADKRN